MERTRKLIMRCEHPTACELCLDDCKRAEVTAHETEIKTELLEALQNLLQKDLLNSDYQLAGHQAIAKATE